MQVTYQKNKLQKQLSSASEIKKNFGVNAKRVANRMDEIAASPNLAILMQIPAANCHSLTGDRNGEWALDISKNFRLIFEIANEPIPKTDNGSIDTIMVTDIRVLEVGDYH